MNEVNQLKNLMESIDVFSEAASNEYKSLNDARKVVNSKRDPLDYIIIRRDSDGMYLVVGHMAWSHWRDQDKYTVVR